MELPHFEIKNNFQKKNSLYEDLLTPVILEDVCQKITGHRNFSVNFDNEGYNKGRLATLTYHGKKSFISFSEVEIRSRNSSFQSFPSALNRYILDESLDKEICFYFHPDTTGNFETPYFNFMYRLMKTANVKFLNANDCLVNQIVAFSSPEDIIIHKERLRDRNFGNRSTYLTRGPNNQIQIFGKTYGANKYETTLICIAISEIANSHVELYEIEEGGLTMLPEISKNAIESLGIIEIFTSTREIEREEFEVNDSLRSPQYIYNLLEKLGDKKCAFCECNIPQIIHGAHIWPVAEIKNHANLSQDEKLNLALDGNNGLWLCQNHHKLLDLNILRLRIDGTIEYLSTLSNPHVEFIMDITPNYNIDENIINNSFISFLNKRNENLNNEIYRGFI